MQCFRFIGPAVLFAAAQAAAQPTEFNLPKLDEAKIAAAGIRKLEGTHITIYTDLPRAVAVDELPRVFDAAVPLWGAYFGVESSRLESWKLIGCVMTDKSRFIGAGLYSSELPDFAHGYFVGSQIWIYDQPSDYYRRHLVLHEGTHAFMYRWLGGAGPPWYMEGMAELLGTHRWNDGRVSLGIFPATRDEVPYWGRFKIVNDDIAAGRGKSLIDVMRFDRRAHLQLEAYGWCWAAVAFLDRHPLTQVAFRELKNNPRDTSPDFSRRFYQRVNADWSSIVEDWQLFIAECDYGYDVPRAAVVRKSASEVPPNGASVTVVTDRGWQSTGLRLQAGKSYRITASGRYQVVSQPQPWPCEPGGVTIQYANGHPLGMLLGAIGDLDGESPPTTPLVTPQPIGLSRDITPLATGTLFLKINEPSSGLADNTGAIKVAVSTN